MSHENVLNFHLGSEKKSHLKIMIDVGGGRELLAQLGLSFFGDIALIEPRPMRYSRNEAWQRRVRVSACRVSMCEYVCGVVE